MKEREGQVNVADAEMHEMAGGRHWETGGRTVLNDRIWEREREGRGGQLLHDLCGTG